METQRCGGCKQIRAIDEFSRSHRGKDGTWCRACVNANARGERVTVPHPSQTCSQCGAAYVPKQIKKNGLFCSRKCKELQSVASGRVRANYLKRTYGITHADYERMLFEQGGGCALCGVAPEALSTGRYRRYLHVDHDEETGRVRGLLCPDHNLLLGRWGHDPDLLRRAVDYLERPGDARKV